MPTRDERNLREQQQLWEQNRKKAAIIADLREQLEVERNLNKNYARTIINDTARIHSLERQKQHLLDMLTPEQIRDGFLAMLEDM